MNTLSDSKRLTVSQAKKLLGKSCARLSDEDLEELLDHLYIISSTLIESFLVRNNKGS